MAIIKLSKNEQRRLSVFTTCLVLALSAWILTSLSNPIKYKIKVLVNFINPPVKRSFRALQPDTVEAVIQGTGWNLLFSKMNMSNQSIFVDLNSLDSKNYVIISSQLKTIRDKKNVDQPVLTFIPDTLYFDFSPRAIKRVPVQLPYKIAFQHQYGIADHITIKPDYVTINGPADVIAKIKQWKTDSLTKADVNDDIQITLGLQHVKESNMSIYPQTVQVNVPVDEFTEKELMVPVKLINNKNYYSVKVFPRKVKVVFTVALSRYPEIDEHFFEAAADLDLWEEHGYKELPVKLTRMPAFCKIVRIEPQNIDFIVKK